MGSELVLNQHTLEVQVNGRAIQLTNYQHRLLSFLVDNEGIAFSCEQLLRSVWGYSPDNSDAGLVRWHIAQLRKRIELNPHHPQIIRSIRSRGYIYQRIKAL